MDITSFIAKLVADKIKNKQEEQKSTNPIISDFMQQAYPDNQSNFYPVWVENDLVNKQPIQGGISQNAPQTMQIQDTQPLPQNNGYQLTSATNTPVQPVATPQPVQNQPAQTNNNFVKGFADFVGDFQRGYNENRNNALAPENLLNTQFSETVAPNNDKLAEYKQQLLNKGYNEDVVNAVGEKKNSGYKEIDDWIKNNSDAYATTKYYDKGVGGKIGEGFGTAARFLNSPTGQAIVGGAFGLMTGDPMYALSSAYNAANLRSKNDIYNQALQKYGIEPSSGFFYNINKEDLNALSNADYRMKRLQEMEDYHDGLLDVKDTANDIAQQRVDNQNNYWVGRNAISNYKAHNPARGKGTGKGTDKGTGNNNYKTALNKDLGLYAGLTAEQQEKIKPKMIQTYGKDFLSQESKLSKTKKNGQTQIVVPGL